MKTKAMPNAKPQNSCSRVGAVNIYTYQLDLKQASNKSKQYKKNAKHESKMIEETIWKS